MLMSGVLYAGVMDSYTLFKWIVTESNNNNNKNVFTEVHSVVWIPKYTENNYQMSVRNWEN